MDEVALLARTRALIQEGIQIVKTNIASRAMFTLGGPAGPILSDWTYYGIARKSPDAPLSPSVMYANMFWGGEHLFKMMVTMGFPLASFANLNIDRSLFEWPHRLQTQLLVAAKKFDHLAGFTHEEPDPNAYEFNSETRVLLKFLILAGSNGVGVADLYADAIHMMRVYRGKCDRMSEFPGQTHQRERIWSIEAFDAWEKKNAHAKKNIGLIQITKTKEVLPVGGIRRTDFEPVRTSPIVEAIEQTMFMDNRSGPGCIGIHWPDDRIQYTIARVREEHPNYTCTYVDHGNFIVGVAEEEDWDTNDLHSFKLFFDEVGIYEGKQLFYTTCSYVPATRCVYVWAHAFHDYAMAGNTCRQLYAVTQAVAGVCSKSRNVKFTNRLSSVIKGYYESSIKVDKEITWDEADECRKRYVEFQLQHFKLGGVLPDSCYAELSDAMVRGRMQNTIHSLQNFMRSYLERPGPWLPQCAVASDYSRMLPSAHLLHLLSASGMLGNVVCSGDVANRIYAAGVNLYDSETMKKVFTENGMMRCVDLVWTGSRDDLLKWGTVLNNSRTYVVKETRFTPYDGTYIRCAMRRLLGMPPQPGDPGHIENKDIRDWVNRYWMQATCMCTISSHGRDIARISLVPTAELVAEVVEAATEFVLARNDVAIDERANTEIARLKDELLNLKEILKEKKDKLNELSLDPEANVAMLKGQIDAYISDIKVKKNELDGLYKSRRELLKPNTDDLAEVEPATDELKQAIGELIDQYRGVLSLSSPLDECSIVEQGLVYCRVNIVSRDDLITEYTTLKGRYEQTSKYRPGHTGKERDKWNLRLSIVEAATLRRPGFRDLPHVYADDSYAVSRLVRLSKDAESPLDYAKMAREEQWGPGDRRLPAGQSDASGASGEESDSEETDVYGDGYDQWVSNLYRCHARNTPPEAPDYLTEEDDSDTQAQKRALEALEAVDDIANTSTQLGEGIKKVEEAVSGINKLKQQAGQLGKGDPRRRALNASISAEKKKLAERVNDFNNTANKLARHMNENGTHNRSGHSKPVKHKDELNRIGKGFKSVWDQRSNVKRIIAGTIPLPIPREKIAVPVPRPKIMVPDVELTDITPRLGPPQIPEFSNKSKAAYKRLVRETTASIAHHVSVLKAHPDLSEAQVLEAKRVPLLLAELDELTREQTQADALHRELTAECTTERKTRKGKTRTAKRHNAIAELEAVGARISVLNDKIGKLDLERSRLDVDLAHRYRVEQAHIEALGRFTSDPVAIQLDTRNAEAEIYNAKERRLAEMYLIYKSSARDWSPAETSRYKAQIDDLRREVDARERFVRCLDHLISANELREPYREQIEADEKAERESTELMDEIKRITAELGVGDTRAERINSELSVVKKEIATIDGKRAKLEGVILKERSELHRIDANGDPDLFSGPLLDRRQKVVKSIKENTTQLEKLEKSAIDPNEWITELNKELDYVAELKARLAELIKRKAKLDKLNAEAEHDKPVPIEVTANKRKLVVLSRPGTLNGPPTKDTRPKRMPGDKSLSSSTFNERLAARKGGASSGYTKHAEDFNAIDETNFPKGLLPEVGKLAPVVRPGSSWESYDHFKDQRKPAPEKKKIKVLRPKPKPKEVQIFGSNDWPEDKRAEVKLYRRDVTVYDAERKQTRIYGTDGWLTIRDDPKATKDEYDEVYEVVPEDNSYKVPAIISLEANQLPPSESWIAKASSAVSYQNQNQYQNWSKGSTKTKGRDKHASDKAQAWTEYQARCVEKKRLTAIENIEKHRAAVAEKERIRKAEEAQLTAEQRIQKTQRQRDSTHAFYEHEVELALVTAKRCMKTGGVEDDVPLDALPDLGEINVAFNEIEASDNRVADFYYDYIIDPKSADLTEYGKETADRTNKRVETLIYMCMCILALHQVDRDIARCRGPDNLRLIELKKTRSDIDDKFRVFMAGIVKWTVRMEPMYYAKLLTSRLEEYIRSRKNDMRQADTDEQADEIEDHIYDLEKLKKDLSPDQKKLPDNLFPADQPMNEVTVTTHKAMIHIALARSALEVADLACETELESKTIESTKQDVAELERSIGFAEEVVKLLKLRAKQKSGIEFDDQIDEKMSMITSRLLEAETELFDAEVAHDELMGRVVSDAMSLYNEETDTRQKISELSRSYELKTSGATHMLLATEQKKLVKIKSRVDSSIDLTWARVFALSTLINGPKTERIARKVKSGKISALNVTEEEEEVEVAIPRARFDMWKAERQRCEANLKEVNNPAEYNSAVDMTNEKLLSARIKTLTAEIAILDRPFDVADRNVRSLDNRKEELRKAEDGLLVMRKRLEAAKVEMQTASRVSTKRSETVAPNTDASNTVSVKSVSRDVRLPVDLEAMFKDVEACKRNLEKWNEMCQDQWKWCKDQVAKIEREQDKSGLVDEYQSRRVYVEQMNLKLQANIDQAKEKLPIIRPRLEEEIERVSKSDTDKQFVANLRDNFRVTEERIEMIKTNDAKIADLQAKISTLKTKVREIDVRKRNIEHSDSKVGDEEELAVLDKRIDILIAQRKEILPNIERITEESRKLTLEIKNQAMQDDTERELKRSDLAAMNADLQKLKRLKTDIDDEERRLEGAIKYMTRQKLSVAGSAAVKELNAIRKTLQAEYTEHVKDMRGTQIKKTENTTLLKQLRLDEIHLASGCNYPYLPKLLHIEPTLQMLDAEIVVCEQGLEADRTVDDALTKEHASLLDPKKYAHVAALDERVMDLQITRLFHIARYMHRVEYCDARIAEIEEFSDKDRVARAEQADAQYADMDKSTEEDVVDETSAKSLSVSELVVAKQQRTEKQIARDNRIKNHAEQVRLAEEGIAAAQDAELAELIKSKNMTEIAIQNELVAFKEIRTTTSKQRAREKTEEIMKAKEDNEERERRGEPRVKPKFNNNRNKSKYTGTRGGDRDDTGEWEDRGGSKNKRQSSSWRTPRGH